MKDKQIMLLVETGRSEFELWPLLEWIGETVVFSILQICAFPEDVSFTGPKLVKAKTLPEALRWIVEHGGEEVRL